MSAGDLYKLLGVRKNAGDLANVGVFVSRAPVLP